ncbi:MAG: MBG domain-containing protein, partial [Bacteroidota bacterium]
TTEVVENSFLPTSIDSIRVLPLQTGAVSFKLQASTLSDDLGLGGTQATVNGMVNQRSLTVTANDTTGAYGAVLPTFEGTVVGLANADYYSDNITVSYTTTATGDSIATFPIQPMVNDPDTRLPNYNLVTNDGTFTVGAASLVVQPNNLTIAYGDTLPLLTGTISGVVNGDNITATYATSADPDSLGTYEITATLQDPDGRLANYQVTNQSGQLEVGPANLRVLLQDASRIYGQTNPTFTFEYQGFVNGEDETVIAEAPTPTSMATPQSDAGTYAITATGGVAPNYNFFFEQATLTVTKASLMVVADDQIRGFGAPNPSLTLSYVGFINGDDTNELDSLPIASTVADAQSDVGTYAISVSGGTDNNYDFAFESGTLTVTQAQATITLTELEQQADGTSRQPKVTTDPPDLNVVLTYDGDTLPPSMTGTYQVIATVDEINYAGVDTATFVLLEEQILSLSAATRTEVYPNPVSDELIVMATGGFRTQLLNLQGVLVRDQRMASNAITMNVRNLPRGVYIVRVLASGDDLLWQGIVRLK